MIRSPANPTTTTTTASGSTPSITLTPPTIKGVAFDVAPVLQRYSSTSSNVSRSELARKASDKIRSQSRCGTFAYNVPRSSIMLTLPSLLFLVIGACLVATRDSSKDWFDDGVLLVAFVFLVVGGVWTVVALIFWIAVWCRNKPKLLPRNLNHVPPSSRNINKNNNNNNNSETILDSSFFSSNTTDSFNSTPQPNSRPVSYSEVFSDSSLPPSTPANLPTPQAVSYSQSTPQESPQRPTLQQPQEPQLNDDATTSHTLQPL